MTAGRLEVMSTYLSVNGRHYMIWIALSGGHIRWEYLAETAEIFCCKFYIQRSHILFQILTAFRAGDGHDIFSLCVHPSQGKLRCFAAFLAGNAFDFLYEIKVLLKIISLKTRRKAAIVIYRQIFKALKLAGQKATPQRTVGDKSNSQLPASRKNFAFGVARPQ